MSTVPPKPPNLVVTSSSNYYEASREGSQVGFSAFLKAKEKVGDQVEIGGVNFHEPLAPKVGRVAKKVGMAVGAAALAGTGLVAAGTVALGALPAIVTAGVGLGLMSQKSELAAIKYGWGEGHIAKSNFQYLSQPKVEEAVGRVGTALLPALVAGGLAVAGVATGGVVPAVLLGASALGLATQAKPVLGRVKDVGKIWKETHAPPEEASTEEPQQAPPEKRSSKIFRLIGKAGLWGAPALVGGALMLAGAAPLVAPALLVAGGLGLLSQKDQLKASLQEAVAPAPVAAPVTPEASPVTEPEPVAQSDQALTPTPAKEEPEFYMPATPGLSIWHTKQSDNVSLPIEVDSAPEQGLTAMLAHNMKEYPTAFHVVHLNGHGHGAHYTAGVNSDQMAEGLNKGCEQGERPADVVLVDSCFGGNWENLNGFSENSSYAVAFEDRTTATGSHKGRIPLTDMISEASDETSARGIALDLARVAGEFFDDPYDDDIAKVPLKDRGRSAHKAAIDKGTDSTVVAIDLKVMREKLNPAMDRVGKALKAELASDKSLKKTLQRARKDNQVDGQGDLTDLGGFLSSVAQQSGSESVKKATAGALEALEASILHRRTGEHYPLSGLSFHSRPHSVKRAISGDASANAHQGDLPQGWTEFVKTAFH